MTVLQQYHLRTGLHVSPLRTGVFALCSALAAAVSPVYAGTYSTLHCDRTAFALTDTGQHRVDSLATITTDTGPFAPWNRDLTRFRSPWMCTGLVRQRGDLLRRDLTSQASLEALKDTAPQRDSLPAAAVAIARACVPRFPLARTAATDVPALFVLALQAGDDTLARAILRHQLSLAPNLEERLAVLTRGIERYVTAEPARLGEAAWAAAVADTLAMAGHASSLSQHVVLLDLAIRAFDRPRMLREARQILALGQTLDFEAVKQDRFSLSRAWTSVLQVAYLESPDSVLALASQAKAYMSRFSSSNGVRMGFDYAKHSVAEVRDNLLPFNPDPATSSRTFPPIEAPFWFPAPITHWPPRGSVTLVVYGEEPNCGHRLEVPGNCWTRWGTFMTQYAAHGLTFVLVDHARGFAVRTLPLSAKAEADSLNWYYRTYRKLPLTLAVVPMTVTRQVPAPDGRSWVTDTTAMGRAVGITESQNYPTPFAQLYDRAGRLLYAGPYDQYALIQALAIRALQ